MYLVEFCRRCAFNLTDKFGNGDLGRNGYDQMNMIVRAVDCIDISAKREGLCPKYRYDDGLDIGGEYALLVFCLPDNVIIKLAIRPRVDIRLP